MGISQSTLAMESGPERDERMEEVPAPEAERNTEEPPTSLVPSAGTLELQPEGETEAPTGKRHTEILELPKVDRRAPATPTVRPGGESSTPATGKSRAERKQEKKTTRKEEKTARKEEKRNRRAKQAEQAEEQEEKPEGTPPKTPVRRKLDAAMESAGSIESVLLLEKEYKALQRDPSHRPNFCFLIDRLISNLRHIPRTVYGPPAGEEERIKLMELRREEEAEEAEAAQRVAEEVDEGSASRKRKLEELEEKKRALEEENDRKRNLRSSRKNLEDSRLSRKLNVEPESNVREIPEYKYQLPARRRSRRPGSSGKLQNWWRTTSSRTARSRRSRRKPQKLTLQHVRIPSKPMKTLYLHFRKPRRRLKYSRSVWEEPWKPQWLSAAKRSVPSSMLRPKTSVRAQKYHELKPDLRSLLDFKRGSRKRKLSRKSRVNLGRRKDLKYQRRPSQDRSGEFVLESNLLKKNQERNGEKRSLKMYGKLEDSSRKVKGTWNASTHRSRKNGRISYEKSYSTWHTVVLPRRKMESCIRREDLDGNFARPENSKVSTSPWSETMESGWYGKARKSKANQSTTSIVTPCHSIVQCRCRGSKIAKVPATGSTSPRSANPSKGQGTAPEFEETQTPPPRKPLSPACKSPVGFPGLYAARSGGHEKEPRS